MTTDESPDTSDWESGLNILFLILVAAKIHFFSQDPSFSGKIYIFAFRKPDALYTGNKA